VPTRGNPREGRVRQRLLAALVVCAVIVVAASAPGVAASAANLSESQRLVGFGQLEIQAVSLAHSLADERDSMAAYVAGGRTTASGAGVSETDRTRVDQQVQQVTEQAAQADTTGAPALAAAAKNVRSLLAGLPKIRQKVLSGPGSVETAVDAYNAVVDSLDGVGAAVARALPARAANADSSALPALSRAVEQASVQRALLVSALTGSGSQVKPVSAAQLSAAREGAALADFREVASATARQQYDQTVTGTDVHQAEGFLQRLTDQARISGADRALKTTTVQGELSARIDLMRGVESSLVSADAARLASVRDSDVTALELRIALAGLCLLLTVGVLARSARSVNRPLLELRRWARGHSEHAAATGNDEFAAIARAVNTLTEETAAVRARAAEQGSEYSQRMSALNALTTERDSLLGRIGSLQGNVHSIYINLSLRTLGLVERQLTLLEGLEDVVDDPEELDVLFKLDHLATRMRRNSENLLVLADAEHHQGAQPKPMPLVDVARAAMSEIEQYERVRIQFLPAGRIVGRAADDTSHLLAELLENATAFSPPESHVQVSGWLLESGEVMISVEDQGIGVPADRLDELNDLLSRTEPAAPGSDTTGMGIYVIGRLAARHGLRVQLRDHKSGGTTAVVVVPRTLITAAEDPDGPSTPVEAAVAGEFARTRRATASGTLPPRPRHRTGSHAGPADPEPLPHRGGPAEPEHHARPQPQDPGAEPARPKHAAEPAPPGPAAAGRTAKGLPQRVPRSTGLSGEPQGAGHTRSAKPVDAEALRRRLGGFQRGLQDGRREAEAEAGTERGTPHGVRHGTEEVRPDEPSAAQEPAVRTAPFTPGGSSEAEGVKEARG
jgi:signal transduction histidine kinase